MWDVSNVTSMDNMFTNSKFCGNIEGWNVTNVESMDELFDGSALEKSGEVPKWYRDL